MLAVFVSGIPGEVIGATLPEAITFENGVFFRDVHTASPKGGGGERVGEIPLSPFPASFGTLQEEE